MDEIEQVSGSTTEPVDAPPVDAPPVDAPPVGEPALETVAVAREVPAAPVSPSSGRPKGLVRWGIAFLAIAVMVGVVSVAAVLLAAGATSSSVQGWLPRTTVAYLEIRADLPGDQRAKVGDILAGFPGFADQSSLDAKVDEALQRALAGSGVSWTADVKPWLGGEVGVAFTAAALDVAGTKGLGAKGLDGLDLGSAPDDGAVALIAVKDSAAATAWVSKQLGGTQTKETYAGGEITIVSGLLKSNLAYAVRGSVLILGPEKAVKAALDTGGSSPVPASESFSAARKSAPAAYFAFGYLDLKAFVGASMAAAGGQADLPKGCLDQVASMVPAWAAGSARAADGALVFEATAPAVGDAASNTKGGGGDIASHLPSTTIAAIEVQDLGPRLVDGVAALKKALACDPATSEAIGQLEQNLGAIGGAEALIGWAGDTAVAVQVKGGTPGGGLAAVVTDQATASRTFDQLQAVLALGGASFGITSRQEPYGDGQLLVVTIPSSVAGTDVPEIAVTVQGGVFVLGTLDWVKEVVDTKPDSSLAKVDAYQRAISLAGGSGISSVYVGIAALRGAVETMIPAEEKARYETEIKPFLEPFEAFASVVEAPGATNVSRAVITFTK